MRDQAFIPMQDIPSGETHYFVLTNPDLTQVALASVVMQDRELFLILLFIGGEVLVGLLTMMALNFSTIFGCCTCCPTFKRCINSYLDHYASLSVAKTIFL